MQVRTFLLLTVFCLAACRGEEFGAPCEADEDCERKLDCRDAEAAPQTAAGQMCSESCDAESDCECWGGTCVRECDVTAPDCPEGSICAVSTIFVSQGYCVLPCASDADCSTLYPFCPEPGGPCSDVESEAPAWSR